MSTFQYFPETDTLSIDLSDKPATGGAVNAGIGGEDEDILFSIDEKGRITNITIERASVRADLSRITLDEHHIIVGRGRVSYTASGLARAWGISRHAVQLTIKRMQAAGHSVGTQDKPGAPIILSEEDAEKIQQWRNAHPRGRPVKPTLQHQST